MTPVHCTTSTSHRATSTCASSRDGILRWCRFPSSSDLVGDLVPGEALVRVVGDVLGVHHGEARSASA
eukprot:CAMPEP_0115713834 /NCGR_PEP_ID=MMETSP0272-20121206/74889_1 /TAXON_ID=71861 /ORGANISM="Scrippsiella trochoidea, Strain CCMP3099" /LENGTH=67 /DNA_ID=CAMNT_0003155883 /DNA_START=67 /DNA_END=266 /DNA_ORIENTATION=+